MAVDVAELLDAAAKHISPPRSRRGAALPPPAPAPAAAAASPDRAPTGRPRRKAAVAARNAFAALAVDEVDEAEEWRGDAVPSPSSSSSDASSPRRAAPRAKKPARRATAPKAGGGIKKKTASSAKPRAKRGERLEREADAAAATAAASAAAAAAAPAGLVRNGMDLKAIAEADAERATALRKLRDLSRGGHTYISTLKKLKAGEHGVAKAPYYSAARAAAARALPSVAQMHVGITSIKGWLADRRRSPVIRVAASRRARCGPLTPKGGRTWCSRLEKKVGVNQPPQPWHSAKPWRARLNLPEQPRETEKQMRAVSRRVRFVDQTADADGVMGAAAPAPGKKTRADVRRGFELNGKAAAFVYSEAVKFVYSHPAGEQGRVALQDGFMNKVFIVGKPDPFGRKATRDSAEYKKQKAAFDAEAQRVKDARAKYLGGRSLLDAHPWLRQAQSNVLTQALRDVSKAFKSNFDKQKAQRARGEPVKPFRVGLKDLRKPSSHTFYVLADRITATHVPRPDLYNAAEAKRRAEGKPASGQRAHRQRQLRERRKWTRLEMSKNFCADNNNGKPVVVYLTRCAELTKKGKLLGDVRFTRDQLGRWHCVVQRPPRAVRPLRPFDDRKVCACDPGVRDFATVYSPSDATVITYCGGERGVSFVMEKALLKADNIITSLRDLKRRTDFSDAAAKRTYEELSRRLGRRKLRLFEKAKNLVKEMHRRVARDLTANFGTILWPPFRTGDMARRRYKGRRRVLRSGTVRRMLSLAHYKFRKLLEHRCLCDGCELLQPGEEFTTQACTFWCAHAPAAARAAPPAQRWLG